LIALAYFLVATALLIRLLLGFFSAIRLWRSATPIAPSSNSFFDANLNLRTSNKISSPVTIGSGIVLPTGYTSWSQEKLRIVLAHERTHVIQRDFHLLTLLALYGSHLVQPAGVVAQTQTLRSGRGHQRPLRPRCGFEPLRIRPDPT
jgi:beta-lactamase regulating signal transducer with metallopeptidase domain